MVHTLLDELMDLGWLDYTDLYILTQLDKAEQINRDDIFTLEPGKDARLFRLESLHLVTRAEIPQDSTPDCKFAYSLHPLLPASLRRLMGFVADNVQPALLPPARSIFEDCSSLSDEDGWR